MAYTYLHKNKKIPHWDIFFPPGDKLFIPYPTS